MDGAWLIDATALGDVGTVAALAEAMRERNSAYPPRVNPRRARSVSIRSSLNDRYAEEPTAG